MNETSRVPGDGDELTPCMNTLVLRAQHQFIPSPLLFSQRLFQLTIDHCSLLLSLRVIDYSLCPNRVLAVHPIAPQQRNNNIRRVIWTIFKLRFAYSQTFTSFSCASHPRSDLHLRLNVFVVARLKARLVTAPKYFR